MERLTPFQYLCESDVTFRRQGLFYGDDMVLQLHVLILAG